MLIMLYVCTHNMRLSYPIKLPNYFYDVVLGCVSSVRQGKFLIEKIRRKSWRAFHSAVLTHAKSEKSYTHVKIQLIMSGWNKVRFILNNNVFLIYHYFAMIAPYYYFIVELHFIRHSIVTKNNLSIRLPRC